MLLHIAKVRSQNIIIATALEFVDQMLLSISGICMAFLNPGVEPRLDLYSAL